VPGTAATGGDHQGTHRVKHGTLRPAIGRAIHGLRAAARPSQRGQSLAELALILPVLLLLTVIALDFGRVYLGYINVQNMARIAANYAANNPLAWSATPDTAIQARYRNQVLEDSTATNCSLPVSGGSAAVPAPQFRDVDGDGTSTSLGDSVKVQITCRFVVATPLISSILGGSIPVTAESDFPIKAGMTNVVLAGGGGGGGTLPAPPTAAFSANTMTFSNSADPVVRVTGPDVVIDYRDASGGGPATGWAWNFGDGVTAVTQDVAHQYHCHVALCVYLVSMTASNAYGWSTAYMQAVVIGDAEVNFSSDRQVINKGDTVTFTNTSTAGGLTFAWDFNWHAGDTPDTTGTAEVVTHAYANAGTYAVALTVTYPSPVGTLPTTVKAGYITVNVGYCSVPSLSNIGLHFDDAQAVWSASGFTGQVKRAASAHDSNSNFKITAQSIASGNGATALCSSDIYVSAP
jgi:PKD repeat protein